MLSKPEHHQLHIALSKQLTSECLSGIRLINYRARFINIKTIRWLSSKKRKTCRCCYIKWVLLAVNHPSTILYVQHGCCNPSILAGFPYGPIAAEEFNHLKSILCGSGIPPWKKTKTTSHTNTFGAPHSSKRRTSWSNSFSVLMALRPMVDETPLEQEQTRQL